MGESSGVHTEDELVGASTGSSVGTVVATATTAIVRRAVNKASRRK